jgi:hypothetical protein
VSGDYGAFYFISDCKRSDNGGLTDESLTI